MSRAKRPFPLEKPRFHASRGVHSPDPLRDDPSHPHASLGPDDHVAGFKDGGMIGNEVVASSEATGAFADGGVIGNAKGRYKGKKKSRKKLGAKHLGSGLASEAAKDIKSRETRLEKQLREAGA